MRGMFDFLVSTLGLVLCLVVFTCWMGLEDLGKDGVGSHRLYLFFFPHLAHYAFDVIVCDVFAKDTNVLQETFDAFYGVRRAEIALTNHFLLEAGWNCLLVVFDSVLFQGRLQFAHGFLALYGEAASGDGGSCDDGFAIAEERPRGGVCESDHCSVWVWDV